MAGGFNSFQIRLLVAAISITGCLASGHRGGRKDRDDDDHHHDEEDDDWKWEAAAGLAVIFGLAVAGAALFSLIGWLTCTLHSKCRKDRVNTSRIKIGSAGSTPPHWSGHLVYKPEMAVGFGAMSDGFLRVGPSHLVRNRPGNSFTDGAKWAMGMNRGKHVFEITWPWGHRGYHATVGLATEDAPVKCRGTRPLVGSTAKTWGLDIVKRKVVHNNKQVLTCPTDGSYVPDKFLMYADLDEGTLGFGNDVTYWGEVIADLPFQGTQTLYLMVGASKWQSELSVTYKGSAPDGAMMDKPDERPPHHLPPLYYQAPPSYSEFGGKTTETTPTYGGPSTSQPQAPPLDVMYEVPGPSTPPPPYSRPPLGFHPHDV